MAIKILYRILYWSNLKEVHLRNIPVKFRKNPVNSFWEEIFWRKSLRMHAGADGWTNARRTQRHDNSSLRPVFSWIWEKILQEKEKMLVISFFPSQFFSPHQKTQVPFLKMFFKLWIRKSLTHFLWEKVMTLRKMLLVIKIFFFSTVIFLS